MAAKTLYAWSNVTVVDEDGNTKKRIKPGDKITAADLGVDDEGMQQYLDSGAVRDYPHPDLGDFQGSPVELAKAQLAAQAAGGFFDTQYGRVGTDEGPTIDPETGAEIIKEDAKKQ